jgi:hypothetical protein
MLLGVSSLYVEKEGNFFKLRDWYPAELSYDHKLSEGVVRQLLVKWVDYLGNAIAANGSRPPTRC